MEMASDQELIERCRAGDRAAFDAVVERHEQRVYAACRSLLHNREDAVDIAQEVFLQAFLSIGALRDASRLAGWLCGIALTLGRAWRRRAGRRQRLWARRPEAADAVEAAEETILDDCLRRLPDDQRIAVGLRFHAELSHQELAEAMGLSMPAAKRLVHQGLLGLRSMMKEHAR